jgi:hypothetical protein|tara:strand:- start:639 stop:1280 length:642 start_codon:yes stop_codon:yes gene_type:complete
MPRTTNNTTDVKDVRNWCREKFGKHWWDVDKTIKKERMSHAHKALADKLPSSPVLSKKVKRAPNPLKPTYKLLMRWSFSNEVCVETRTSVDPATCIGSSATYNKIGKCEKLPTCGGVYLMDTSCFGFDWEDCDVEEDLYFGNHPFPGYGDRENFNLVKMGDTVEMVAQKIQTYKGVDELMIHDAVWEKLSPTMQEALLRDSLAKELYICNAVF